MGAPLDHARRDADVPLDERVLRALLDRALPSPHWHCRVEATTPSTNTTLLERVRADPHAVPAVLTTDRQSAGRGRRGRTWRSAAGASLTVSYAIAIARPVSALDGVTLACGLAVRDALVPLGVDARLKWPNDVLVDGRKLAGILVETATSTANERTVLVVGIGINVARVDEDAAITDLASCGVVSCDRHALIVALAAALAARLAAFARDGFASARDDYAAVDAFRDRRVVLSQRDGTTIIGVARGLDAHGALRVDTADGPLTVVAGEVSLRPADA